MPSGAQLDGATAPIEIAVQVNRLKGIGEKMNQENRLKVIRAIAHLVAAPRRFT